MSWCCYLIRSLDSNKTYIGSTNNFQKRLRTHNRGKGAKYTKGQTWVPVMIVLNMEKRECLSFEYQWKRLSRRRTNKRFAPFKAIGIILKYGKNTLLNRILDLLHFMNNHIYENNKYTINFPSKRPILFKEVIIRNMCYDINMNKIPFPYFVTHSHTC